MESIFWVCEINQLVPRLNPLPQALEKISELVLALLLIELQ